MESGAYGMRIADPLATLFRLRDPLMLSQRVTRSRLAPQSASRTQLSLCPEADSGYSEPKANPGGVPWAFVFVDA